MNTGLYQGASALRSLEAWQEVLSRNIASSTVNGYKQVSAAMQGVPTGSMPASTAGGFEQVLSTTMPQAYTKLDFQDGPLVPGDQQTDMALRGPGFFQVKTPDGRMLLTRDGSFHVNDQFELVNRDGYIVQGRSGPLTVDPKKGQLTVDAQGNLFQGPDSVGKLAIVKPALTDELRPTQGGFVLPEGGPPPPIMDQPVVVQGHLEGSNVSPVLAMVDMISVSRAYDINQKVLTTYDENYGRAITNLGPR